ncbi:hypothetical protein N9V42_03455 [Flavobacteriaceae bacterium]|nr:hypothetical protein [Flavobacteriaceae bacterium]MDC3238878.1 hypothetical protein [Flavobacteriaceae bacterium]
MWPGKKLIIKNLNLKEDSTIVLLASGEKLAFQNNGNNLVVYIPEYNPLSFIPEDHYAYVFMITNANSSP